MQTMMQNPSFQVTLFMKIFIAFSQLDNRVRCTFGISYLPPPASVMQILQTLILTSDLCAICFSIRFSAESEAHQQYLIAICCAIAVVLIATSKCHFLIIIFSLTLHSQKALQKEFLGINQIYLGPLIRWEKKPLKIMYYSNFV